MRFRSLAAILLCGGMLAAPLLPTAAAARVLPPSAFIRHPAFQQVTISPDGKHLAVVSAIKNTNKYQLAIVPTKSVVKHKPKVTAHFGLTDREIFLGIIWINNKRLLATTGTKSSGFARPHPTGELYATNVDGSQKGVLMGPKMGYFFEGILNRLPKNPRAVLIEATQGGTNRAIAYWLDVYTGKLHHVATSPAAYGALLTDHDGNVRVATGVNTETGWPKLYYRKAGSMDWQNESKLIGNKEAAAAMETGGPIMFGPDNNSVNFKDWTDNAAETMGLYSYDPSSGEKKRLYVNPKADIAGAIGSFSRKKIVGVRIEPGKPQILALDPKSPRMQVLAAVHQALPKAHVEITSWTKDGNEAIVRAWGDTVSPAYYLYASKPKPSLTFLFHAVPWIKSDDLSPMKAISFKSRDGLTIHGYLTLPRGRKAQNLPLVMYVHGGPYLRTDWGYDPVDFDSVAEQILANHGYAVLSLNYRGSTGYGFKFLEAGFRHWGDTMQNDLADGVKWAIKQGYANPKRVCIFGASYGGYAALMSPERFPNMYQCAIGYDGVYDLFVMKSRKSDVSRSAAGRLYENTVLGSNGKQLKAFSPSYNADKLKIPVFLLHGGRDVRAPVAGYKAMVAAIKKHGTPLKTLYESDEGHGFYSIPHREKAWKEMLAFFNKYIGPGAAAAAKP
jgi:dipeptidyl aminopeptidase/acylaminoacyl peptidase